MKRRNRLLSIFLVCFMLLSLMPLSALAAEDNEDALTAPEPIAAAVSAGEDAGEEPPGDDASGEADAAPAAEQDVGEEAPDEPEPEPAGEETPDEPEPEPAEEATPEPPTLRREAAAGNRDETYNITVIGGTAKVGGTEVTSAAPGATVYVYPTRQAGTYVTGFRAEGLSSDLTSVYYNTRGAYYTFTMPARDVTLTAETAAQEAYTLDLSEGKVLINTGGLWELAYSIAQSIGSTAGTLYTSNTYDFDVDGDGNNDIEVSPGYRIVMLPGYSLEDGYVLNGPNDTRYWPITFKTSAVVEYTVTFDVGAHGTAPAPQTVEDGETANEPAAPTAEGWVFGGWYTEAACTNAFDFSTPITADITLFAKWTEKTPALEVTFKSVSPADGTCRPGDEFKITFDVKNTGNVDLKVDDFEWKNHNGVIASTALGSEIVLKPGESLSDYGEEAILVISPIAGIDADPSTETADMYGLIKITCIAKGYEPRTDTVLCTADATHESGLYKPTYTVTFDVGGHGTAPAAQTVKDGQTATKPANLTETGWTFGGWYTEAACANAFDFATPITADITLFAKWTENAPVEITYTVTDGANSTWTKGSGATVTITVKRNVDDDTCFSHFTGVQISGTTLAASGYEAKAGSTVITLKADTLQQFSAGTHAVTINFDDGAARTDLIIKAAQSTGKSSGSPKTGDSSRLGLWLALSAVGALGVAGLGIYGKKRRNRVR